MTGATVLKALGYGWRVAVNLIEIVVVMAIFSGLRGRFETTVVAILGVIYVTVRTIGISSWMMAVNTAIRQDLQFFRISELAQDPLLEEYKEARKKSEADLSIATVKAWINVGGLAVTSLICLFQLLTNLNG